MFGEIIKNFGINLNALNEKNTVSSGDLLTGHMSFDLKKETKISSITVSVTGKVRVHWSTSGGGGRKGRRSRKNFSGKLEFFNLKSVILQEDRGMQARSEFGCMQLCKQPVDVE